MRVDRRLALPLLAVLLVGCDRERRELDASPAPPPEPAAITTSDLHAGPGAPVEPKNAPWQDNRWAVSEGKRLFEWFNCAGCHAPGGGGGMGPPLIDREWIYGSAPANVYTTIVEGRPNGMPSFRDGIPPSEIWKIVAYVRTLGSLTPKDVWPARGDELAAIRRGGPRNDDAASRVVPVETARP
jgi:cytochrome c oxidase cbb3-type subunit 3